MSIEQCGRLIEEIEYRNTKYKKILETLCNELSKVHNPSSNQLIFVRYFSDYLVG